MEKTYLITKEQYLAVKEAWKKQHGNAILYNILRSFPAKRGYTKITNPIKLANGMNEWEGFNAARNRLRIAFKEPQMSRFHTAEQNNARVKQYEDQLKPYGIEYSPELFAKIREILNEE